jgi:hypothetical protein
MADISDVEDALVSLLTATLYPNGSSQASILGSLCRIYRGWPNQTTLNNDLSAGVVNITISSDNEFGTTTTRYLNDTWTTRRIPGVSASAQNGTINVGGTPTRGDLIGALIDGAPFVYRIQAGDTSQLVAANLALAIQAARPATYGGTAVTVPGCHSLTVRCVTDGQSVREIRRQEKDFRIASWCPTPAARDDACSAIDAACAVTSFLPLPDGSNGRMIYRNTASYDQAQNVLLYRRDLIFRIEYPTMSTTLLPSMLFGQSELNGNPTYG